MNLNLYDWLFSAFLVFVIGPLFFFKTVRWLSKASDKMWDKILPDSWKWENMHPGYYEKEYGENTDRD